MESSLGFVNESFVMSIDKDDRNGNVSTLHETCQSAPNGSSMKMKHSMAPHDGIDACYDEPQKRIAVQVTNACKKYKMTKSPVLKNFNMTVKEGTIYSLLGSSGCGKTTILACCVGLRNVDSGKIRIYGSKPGTRESGVPGKRVGYMPQELSLYGEFTIQESLQYYGSMYGMTAQQLEQNISFLIGFLDLPPPSRRINSLSGGQQRRVSFAMALVHNPELLILDEPTVGVDPLLRQSIWNHLCQLVSTGQTTVIITTHYIEEARQSDTIGLMRSGHLLTEDSPGNLLKIYETSLLEEVVLKLCLQDNQKDGNATVLYNNNKEGNRNDSTLSIIKFANGSSFKETKTPDVAHERNDDRVVPIAYKNRSEDDIRSIVGRDQFQRLPKREIAQLEPMKESFQRICALTWKNVIVLLRNLLFLLFIFLVPASQVVLICVAIGQDPLGLKVALLNRDSNLTLCDDATGCIISDNYTGRVSCRFLHYVNHNSLLLIPYDDEEKAIEDAKQNKVWGFVQFGENFTENMKDRVLFGNQAEIDTVLGSRIQFRLDLSNKQIGREFYKLFLKAFKKFIRGQSKECGFEEARAELPLFFDTTIYGTDDTTFTEFLAPSVLLGILFFFPLCISGISYISDKRNGTLDRSLVAGVTTFEVMVSYLITQLVILLGQTALSYIIMVFAFDIKILGPPIWAVLIAVLIGIAGMSMGFLLGTVCTEEIQAVLLALGTFFPNFLLAGMVWPVEGMPGWLQYVSYALPCTLACETLRSIVSRGVGLMHQRVWPGFVSTIAWIFFYWALVILIHRFSFKK